MSLNRSGVNGDKMKSSIECAIVGSADDLERKRGYVGVGLWSWVATLKRRCVNHLRRQHRRFQKYSDWATPPVGLLAWQSWLVTVSHGNGEWWMCETSGAGASRSRRDMSRGLGNGKAKRSAKLQTRAIDTATRIYDPRVLAASTSDDRSDGCALVL
jgi:hypothetical protein